MKTVKVRVAVAVDPTGDWSSCGYAGANEKHAHANASKLLEHGESHFWLEAELPVPEVGVVRGNVREARP